MPRYTILTGDKYSVVALTEEEALEKLNSFFNGLDDCPCNKSFECECVEEIEGDTWVVQD